MTALQVMESEGTFTNWSLFQRFCQAIELLDAADSAGGRSAHGVLSPCAVLLLPPLLPLLPPLLPLLLLLLLLRQLLLLQQEHGGTMGEPVCGRVGRAAQVG